MNDCSNNSSDSSNMKNNKTNDASDFYYDSPTSMSFHENLNNDNENNVVLNSFPVDQLLESTIDY